jgi:mannose-6-phosphate isomerase
MEKLRTRIQPYAWGSNSAIASLRGLPPTAEPQAELWAGAHPSAPSQLFRDGRWVDLDALIAEDPITELGEDVAERFGERLPFLTKILAAGKPLSLQTHPDPAAARAGFLRENAEGVGLAAPNRTYRDDSAKPEILIALTPFEGLCGFRPVGETLRFLDDLDVPLLQFAANLLRETPTSVGLRAVVEKLFALSDEQRTALISQIVAQATIYRGPQGALSDWIPSLAKMYPNDVGVALTIFLNHVTLMPGQALFLKAGNLHAYLCGTGVEVMANSDNVLRAGFTEKHIDIPELLSITDFSPLPNPLFSPVIEQAPGAVVTRFQPPVRDFAVERIDLDGTTAFAATSAGPSILLCTSGEVNGFAPTESAYLRPGSINLSGKGTVWHITVGSASGRNSSAQ